MKTIATHNGKFHPDDVFAVASIMLLEGKENISVIRTRDQEKIDAADWVVDVGFEYNPDKLRFDHHQQGSLTRENGIQYAAFGLVWLHYGEKIAGSKEVAEKIAEKLVLPIDAHDVGVALIELNERQIKPVELFDVIYSYVPPWQSDLDVDKQFLLATDFAYDYLVRLISKAEAKVKMKEYATKLYAESDNKKIIESSIGVGAAEFTEYEDVLAVISPDKNGSGNWIVSAVPAETGPFEFKARFPEEWGGLEGSALDEISGLDGALFCHKNGFFFIGTSREVALKATEFLS